MVGRDSASPSPWSSGDVHGEPAAGPGCLRGPERLGLGRREHTGLLGLQGPKGWRRGVRGSGGSSWGPGRCRGDGGWGIYGGFPP